MRKAQLRFQILARELAALVVIASIGMSCTAPVTLDSRISEQRERAAQLATPAEYFKLIDLYARHKDASRDIPQTIRLLVANKRVDLASDVYVYAEEKGLVSSKLLDEPDMGPLVDALAMNYMQSGELKKTSALLQPIVDQLFAKAGNLTPIERERMITVPPRLVSAYVGSRDYAAATNIAKKYQEIQHRNAPDSFQEALSLFTVASTKETANGQFDPSNWMQIIHIAKTKTIESPTEQHAAEQLHTMMVHWPLKSPKLATATKVVKAKIGRGQSTAPQ